MDNSAELRDVCQAIDAIVQTCAWVIRRRNAQVDPERIAYYERLLLKGIADMAELKKRFDELGGVDACADLDDFWF